MASVHQINNPQVVVIIVETVVAEEEDLLAGEAEEVDVVGVDNNKDSSNRRNHPILHSTKESRRPQSIKYVVNLATLRISVGTGHHRLVEIHLGVVSPSPEVETKVCTGQAVAYKDVEEDGSPQ